MSSSAPHPHGRVAETHTKVRWSEVDAAGRVFYPHYFSWMGETTLELFRGEKQSFAALFRGGTGVPVVEAGIRLRRPARYDDFVTIEALVTEVRARSFRVEHRVLRDDDLLAAGHEVRVLAITDLDEPGSVKRGELSKDLVAWLKDG